ncbi:DUF1673 family protein [Methanococcoides orientis]|uniref:DUF1673 domain-containing protein n=1 Tax=Methanococcoides orientis TaxID=2822137 RepID=UPI001E2ED2F9|nr:DUF1673 domain-containing protein [Methanococcoides orientis]UGV41326.1 DUF1673 family protein [Methanococcoides orientis]
MTINVTGTIRKVMGWCPNATAGGFKSSQQIDFSNTSLKPSGIRGGQEQMKPEKEIRTVILSLVALSILIIWQLTSYLGSDMSSLQANRFTIGTSGLAIIWIFTMLKFKKLYREKADRE